MQKLMGDEGWGVGGLVFLYWPQVSVQKWIKDQVVWGCTKPSPLSIPMKLIQIQ